MEDATFIPRAVLSFARDHASAKRTGFRAILWVGSCGEEAIVFYSKGCVFMEEVTVYYSKGFAFICSTPRYFQTHELQCFLWLGPCVEEATVFHSKGCVFMEEAIVYYSKGFAFTCSKPRYCQTNQFQGFFVGWILEAFPSTCRVSRRSFMVKVLSSCPGVPGSIPGGLGHLPGFTRNFNAVVLAVQELCLRLLE